MLLVSKSNRSTNNKSHRGPTTPSVVDPSHAKKSRWVIIYYIDRFREKRKPPPLPPTPRTIAQRGTLKPALEVDCYDTPCNAGTRQRHIKWSWRRQWSVGKKTKMKKNSKKQSILIDDFWNLSTPKCYTYFLWIFNNNSVMKIFKESEVTKKSNFFSQFSCKQNWHF